MVFCLFIILLLYSSISKKKLLKYQYELKQVEKLTIRYYSVFEIYAFPKSMKNFVYKSYVEGWNLNERLQREVPHFLDIMSSKISCLFLYIMSIRILLIEAIIISLVCRTFTKSQSLLLGVEISCFFGCALYVVYAMILVNDQKKKDFSLFSFLDATILLRRCERNFWESEKRDKYYSLSRNWNPRIEMLKNGFALAQIILLLFPIAILFYIFNPLELLKVH